MNALGQAGSWVDWYNGTLLQCDLLRKVGGGAIHVVNKERVCAQNTELYVSVIIQAEEIFYFKCFFTCIIKYDIYVHVSNTQKISRE